MGAFFVRRNSGNPLYRRILERYIHMATQEGVCQAVFLEGGLSRDGRLGAPKLGVMDYMLRSLTPETRRRSLWFVFRTTTGFILRNLVLMVLSRWRRYGYACVNFGTPLSIKAYCRETGTVFSQLERNDRFPKIETLCRQLMSAIADVIPVLPVSLVSAVFLASPATGLDMLQVEQRANLLIDELQKNQAPVLETPRSTRMAAIADAIDLMQLRGLIVSTDGRYTAVAQETAILRYYANAIAHWLPGRKWE
jgi:glycerol-3-phosphate O-acyltransferase